MLSGLTSSEFEFLNSHFGNIKAGVHINLILSLHATEEVRHTFWTSFYSLRYNEETQSALLFRDGEGILKPTHPERLLYQHLASYVNKERAQVNSEVPYVTVDEVVRVLGLQE